MSSQDIVHIFNHSLLYVSNLWSNMINTDLLPVAPVLLLVAWFLQLGSSSQCQITIEGTKSADLRSVGHSSHTLSSETSCYIPFLTKNGLPGIVYGSINLKIVLWGLHTNLQVPQKELSKIPTIIFYGTGYWINMISDAITELPLIISPKVWHL